MWKSLELVIERVYVSEQITSLVVHSLGPEGPEASKVAKFWAQCDMVVERAEPLSAGRRHLGVKLRARNGARLFRVSCERGKERSKCRL